MGSPDNLQFYAAVSNELAKPLLVGEIGYSPDVRAYDTPAALAMLRATLPVIVELELPLTLYWTFNDDRGMEEKEKSLDLRYGRRTRHFSSLRRRPPNCVRKEAFVVSSRFGYPATR